MARRDLTPRDLTPEDAALWRHITRNVHPYRRGAQDIVLEETPGPAPPDTSEPPALRRPTSIRPSAPSLAPLQVGAPVDVDGRTARRLKRGEMSVDGRIDLHGLTLEQAHATLTAFIRGAQSRGARCVMVVTGKGKRDERGERQGKIRRETPHWLNQPALRPLVLAVTEAHTRDGGTGAYYVLLKRKR